MILTFSNPSYLLFLLIIPALIIIHLLTLRGLKKRALKFANFESISRISGVNMVSKNITSLILNLIVIGLIIFSMSGLTLHRAVETSDASFMLIIDSSQSMSAVDVSPSRIEFAKEYAKKFVDSAPAQTRLGLVSFSGVSYIERDIGTDKFALKEAINDIDIRDIGGTNILDAVIIAANMLKGEESKMILLFSDGQMNLFNMKDIIEYANKDNVIIDTFGIGTLQGGTTSLGVTSKLNEDTLKAIPYNTNGRYYRISDMEADDFFTHIIQTTRKQVSIGLSNYLLILALAVFIIGWILINTRYRLIP